MALLNYKDGKVMDIIMEFVKVADQTDYIINGVDLGKAVFFYRETQQIFETIPNGDYTIVDETETTGNIILRIDSPTLLDSAYEFQICYENTKLSSLYVTALPDIVVLKDKYNEAIADLHVLWETIRETGMIKDTTKLSVVIPELQDGEAFAWDDTNKKFYAVQVADLQLEANDKKDQLDAHTVIKKAEIDTHVDTVSKPSLKTYGEGEMDSYMTNTIEPAMDAYELVKEGELDARTATHLQALDDKFDDLKHDNGVIPAETVSLHDLTYGRWWTADITQFADAPTNLGTGDEVGVLDIDIADGRKLIKYYSVTEKIFFQIEESVGVYTPWAETGSEDANIAVVGNLGAGFKFAPVRWDVTAQNYVLAIATDGADAIAVNADTDAGTAYFDSRVKIPATATDQDGNAFVNGEFYWTSQTQAGKFQRTKPETGIRQCMFQVMTYDTELYAMLEIEAPEDMTPVAIVDGEETVIATKSYVDGKDTAMDTRVTDLEDKVAVKDILSVADISLTYPVTTAEIIEAMPDGSRIMLNTDDTQVTDLPVAYGTLEITRLTPYRVVTTATGDHYNGRHDIYSGGYNLTGGWTGWIAQLSDGFRYDGGTCGFLDNILLWNNTKDYFLNNWRVVLTFAEGSTSYYTFGGEVWVICEDSTGDSKNHSAHFRYLSSSMYFRHDTGEKYLNYNREGSTYVECRIFNNTLQIKTSQGHEDVRVIVNGATDASNITINSAFNVVKK